MNRVSQDTMINHGHRQREDFKCRIITEWKKVISLDDKNAKRFIASWNLSQQRARWHLCILCHGIPSYERCRSSCPTDFSQKTFLRQTTTI